MMKPVIVLFGRERGKISKGQFLQNEVKKLDFVSQVHLKV